MQEKRDDVWFVFELRSSDEKGDSPLTAPESRKPVQVASCGDFSPVCGDGLPYYTVVTQMISENFVYFISFKKSMKIR